MNNKLITKIFIISVFVYVILLPEIFGGVINNLKPIYSVKESYKIPYIEPKLFTFPFKKYGISNFPIPVDNAVGTISLNNAITFVYFEEDKLRFETRAKDFVPNNRRGDLNYMPIFSKDQMGYTQTRLLRLLDIKTNKVKTYSVSRDIYEDVINFSEIDPSKNLCMVYLFKNVRSDEFFTVRIIDFSDGTPVIKAEKTYDHIVNFKSFKEGVIVYHYDKNTIEILDTNLKPLKHPLKDIYDNYLYNPAKNIYLCARILEIKLHPTLPFAIFNVDDEREESHQLVVSWGNGVKIFKLMESSFSYNFFSPDGKWFINVLRMYIGDQKIYKQLMMRVYDEGLPYYLGKPIEMKRPGEEDDTGNFAWTSNPMCLTANGAGKYFNWDLNIAKIKGEWRIDPVKIKYNGVFGEIEKQ